ncbi:MAG: hypothetical protein ACK5IP_02515 [Paracoccus sp. (in: a-proteobacteria)]
MIQSPTIVPSKGVALAVVEHSVDSTAFPADPEQFELRSVAAFDLATGETRHVMTPEITGDTYPASLHELVVGEDVLVVLAGDEEGGDTRSYYAFAYDLDSYEPRYTIELPLEDYPNHIPSELQPAMQVSDGHLLIATSLRRGVEDTDPLMMVYDLGTGQLQRVLGLQELDPEAESGWFGRRPRAPDQMFETAIAEGGILFAPDYGDPGKEEARLLAYDLSRAEALPEQPIAQQDDKDAYLVGLDADRMYFSTHDDNALLTPIAHLTRTWQSDLWGVPRQAGQATLRYADPFPVEGEMPSTSDTVYAEVTMGAHPFSGSSFPGLMRRDGRYLVAAARTAPLADEGATALAVFDATSGAQHYVMVPGNPQTEFFGDSFDLKDDMILIPIRDDREFRSRALQDLALYRLNDP